MRSPAPTLDEMIDEAKKLELNATAIYLRMAKCSASAIAQKDAMTQAARAAVEYGRMPESQITNQSFTDFMWKLENCKRALQKAAMERVKRNR